MKQKDTDLLYASAALRAKEAKLVSSEKIIEAAASGAAEAERLIMSREIDGEASTPEERLSVMLCEAYKNADAAGVGNTIDFLRYKYDCANVKTAMKSFFAFCESSETDKNYFPMAKIGIDVVKAMPKRADYSALPKNMARAAAEAHDAYTKTGSAGVIDRIIDAACFLDMLDAAEISGEPVETELVRLDADLKNIMMCFRAVGDSGRALLYIRESLIKDVGRLDTAALEGAARSGEKALCELIRSDYPALAEAACRGGDAAGVPLSELECICDNIWGECAAAKFTPFGVPVVISYITACECEVKNLRILLAATRAGLSSERIRLMLRASYV